MMKRKRKEINVSWVPQFGADPRGRIRITNTSVRSRGEHIEIVPEHFDTSSLRGFFIAFLDLLKFLGWEKEGALMKNPQGGYFVKLSLK